MITPGSANPLLAAGDEGYQISRSLRFNSADSAYLNRTFGTNSSNEWTFSAWIKKPDPTGDAYLLYALNGTVEEFLCFNGLNQIEYTRFNSSTVTYVTQTTVAEFRDPSAWYHVVARYSTSTSRLSSLTVNGIDQTLTAVTGGTPPTTRAINANVSHQIGRYSTGNYGDMYLTEVHFVSSSVAASNFGETDSATGVWKPKKYAGTYGTNGFYLNFSDNSGTTSTTLGKDSSGNSNNWTPNNFSVTAGADNDSMIDVPTSYADGGNGRGNYATLNPVSELASSATFSQGALQVKTATTGDNAYPATIFVSSGKWYAEFTQISVASGENNVGVIPTTYPTGTGPGFGTNSYAYRSGGNKVTAGTQTAFGATYTTNDIIGVALDLDNGRIWFSKNGTWQASGNPSSNTSPAFTGLSGLYTFAVGDTGSGNDGTILCNFGQRAFAYTPPTGFKALNTQNLPTPTIGATSSTRANKYFDVTTYTGNGSSQLITNSGGFTPDLFWAKRRSSPAFSHMLFDVVRGANSSLSSDLTMAEFTSWTGQSFGSGGFTVSAAASGETNGSAAPHVAWQWQAGSSNVSNTSGTITSTVRANTTAGFSIVTYTGTGANATVGHGLGVAPKMLITKRRNVSQSWAVYHTSLGAANALYLNLTDASALRTNWNSTAPTSSVFSVGTANESNASTGTYVAYCFAEVPGYSAFGSYTGNGSTDGPFVYLGFRPRFIMIKNASAVTNWEIMDTSRDPINVAYQELYPNSSSSENASTADEIDILSNGFKLRSSNAIHNANSNTFIYAAFAEAPFKYALAR